MMAEAEPLCCCEFRNHKGDKSHILACFCDCEALDESVDRCFKCESVPNEIIQRFLNDISDRCRIPGLTGKGAIQVNIEVAGPIFLVPISLLIATYGPVTTFFILFLILPLFMYQLYRCWKKQTHKARTKFFYAWGLTSVILMYLVYEVLVFDLGKGDYSENIMLTLGLIFVMYFVILAKRDPGVLTPFDKLHQEIKKMENGNSYLKYNGIVKQGDTDIHQGGNVKLSLTNLSVTVSEDASSHCDECGIMKPDRAGHCNACNVCVAERDHHCVWIDNCVGRNNHRSFFLALTSFVLCGFYGVYLTMQSICEGTDTLFCSYQILYKNLGNSFGFVGCCYTFAVICLMSALLVNQFILISQNITSQELFKAAAKNQTWFFLYATRNPHNKGFFKNWYSFITKTRSKNMYYDL